MCSMRSFEALGTGRLFLTDYNNAVRAMFEPDVHLAMSDSPGQTLDLAERYLTEDGVREEVAKAGQAEAYEKHTYEHRIKYMLEKIGLIIDE